MSLKHDTKAYVIEYSGPFFPQLVDFLNNSFDPGKRERDKQRLWDLVTALKKESRIVYWGRIMSGSTYDLYEWYLGIAIRVGSHKHILLTFPHWNDNQKQDSSHLDRSIAVYLYQCTLNEAEEVFKLIEKLY